MAEDKAKDPGAERDAAIAKARDAELKRQQAVTDAVAKAGAEELPKIGGPLLEPGLGR